MSFTDVVKRELSWICDDGFVSTVPSGSIVRFRRVPLSIWVEKEQRTHELFIDLTCGKTTVNLLEILVFQGKMPEFVCNPHADVIRNPTPDDDRELADALHQLHAPLREAIRDANEEYFQKIVAWRHVQGIAWFNEPLWIKAARLARVFASQSDYAGVVEMLEKYESELDDETRALLNEARSKSK